MTDRNVFIEQVWQYYQNHGRILPWRQPGENNWFDPYKILLSEIMLQQTQVTRVVEKYKLFLDHYPSIAHLAEAKLADVLIDWSGLGYNRRARYLHEAARMLATSNTPWTYDLLVSQKGIGGNTAKAILVYSYNLPEVFIETNIRTVYIHHFFKGRIDVSDAQLIPFVLETLDKEHPREWYYALMDYGTYIKAQYGNISRASSTYMKQPQFEGSLRQLRGRVLKLLLGGPILKEGLYKELNDKRLGSVLYSLQKDHLITINGKSISL